MERRSSKPPSKSPSTSGPINMPTPSKTPLEENLGTQRGQWTAGTDTPRRSVFGNYAGKEATHVVDAPTSAECLEKKGRVGSPLPTAASAIAIGSPTSNQAQEHISLQTSIDIAMARAFLYQFLARAFDD